MDIIFVRHGQPLWAIDGLSQADPHLTELGRRQADLAAQRISSEDKTARELIVSPAIRAQETAAPISTETGLEVDTIDGLLEIQMPDWRGVTEEAVIEIFRTTRHRSPDQWWDGLPGGESFRDFHDRVTTSLDDLLKERGITRNLDDPRLWDVAEDPGRIVIVAHGGTNSVCLTHLMGAPPSPWEWEKFVLFHASFARVKFIPLAGAHVPSLRTFNDQDHIPVELRSR
ncbi:MAG: histidine phosphatase family protein [Acidimicrobiia bacterium]|nr:MAG: histidine phosphatase family protein [Acidimicrobiia bacterium]